MSQFATQRLKVRQAGVAHNSCFTIDDCFAHLQLRRCFGDRREFIGPVVTATRIDGHTLGADVDLGTIAVGLDFVDPTAPGGGPLMEGGIARLDEAGHGRLRCPDRLAAAAGRHTLNRGGTRNESNGPPGSRFPPWYRKLAEASQDRALKL